MAKNKFHIWDFDLSKLQPSEKTYSLSHKIKQDNVEQCRCKYEELCLSESIQFEFIMKIYFFGIKTMRQIMAITTSIVITRQIFLFLAFLLKNMRIIFRAYDLPRSRQLFPFSCFLPEHPSLPYRHYPQSCLNSIS